MLVTAIATVAAVMMMSRQHLDLRRSSNIFAADQAWLFVQGVESWAVEVMQRDRNDNQTDHLGEDWATVLPPIAVEGGVVAGKVEDLQGRFNLNNLIKDGEASQWDIGMLKRLFEVLDIETQRVQAIVDWLDKDVSTSFPDGAEDNVYLGREIAYRTANNLMVSPSELLLVDGISYEDYQTLRPFISTLPQRTALNVNTATAELLQVLVPGLGAGDAEQLINERQDAPFKSVQDFRAHALVAKLLKKKPGQDEEIVAENSMAVSSDYYLLTAAAQYGRAEIYLASIIARDDKGTQIIMHGQGEY
jgi:general secretion pathway protein K